MKPVIRSILACGVICSTVTHGATFSVININDSGPGSLRQAILDANTASDLDSINFNIPGAGPHTITPLSPLPAITGQTIINGFTQPGAKPNELRAGNNAIFKIELNGMSAGVGANGLDISGSGNSNCVVRGLVINRFSGNGIYFRAFSASIVGNFIGTDITGSIARPNGVGIIVVGVVFSGTTVVYIGGPNPADRNVISGNASSGIIGSAGQFKFVSPIIRGNFIGTDATGTVPLGNGGNGMLYDAGCHGEIGGTEPGTGNVIAANGGNGFLTVHRFGKPDFIKGNAIGTDLTGRIALGNAHNGIDSLDSGLNLIEGNFIANNLGSGVRLYWVNFYYATTIRANSIYDNFGLGINWQHVAPPTTSEPTNTVTMNGFPVVTNVTTVGGTTIITGTLSNAANSSFVVELFRSPNFDSSGYGEGKYRLGSTNIITDGSGNASFAFPTTQSCAGQFVTATTSQAATSEFGPVFVVPGVFAGNFQFKSADFVATEGGSAALIEVVRTESSSGAASVDFLTLSGTATVGSDFTATNGTLSFANGETNKSFLVAITDDTITESPETISLQLTNPSSGSGLGLLSTATVTIFDKSLTANNPIVTEGNAGNVFCTFNVSLSAASTQTVSVAYATSNGTAIAGSDYVAESGVLSFTPGETLKPVMVTVNGDTVAEANETLYLVLSNPTNAALGQAIGTATIQNDDNSWFQITRLANNVTLSWTTNSEGLGLFTSTSIGPSGAWLSVTDPVTISNGWFTVINGLSNQARFYQLRAP